jgi:alpha-D-xyloside xylohydrolase
MFQENCPPVFTYLGIKKCVYQNKNRMKTIVYKKLLILISAILFCFNLTAQIDKTNLITNPSFETGDYTGWTWTGRVGGWQDVNTDGDGTKNGEYIAGHWDNNIRDVECFQFITGLPTGHYRVTALATVSTGRLTNQRLFANNNSTLYGASNHPAYSATNLAILAAASEVYTFGNIPESAMENGPFLKLSAVTHITDGNLKFGFKFSGKGTTQGYNFSHTSRGDAGFFKFDHFTLTEVSADATLDNLLLTVGALNETFNPNQINYTATLPVGAVSVTPIVASAAEGQTITGVLPVDVSGGSGTSTITVKSIDNTQTKIYTIQYTVLQNSYEQQADGVKFFVPGGEMKLRVCTDDIIQLRYALRKPAVPASDTIIVNKVWMPVAYSVSEEGDNVVITTNKLKVKVSKTTFLVEYYDLNNNLLLSESAKNFDPITLQSVHLTTETNTCAVTFHSPSNEALFGLGQHQQGFMNLKGKIQTLDEQNREVALNLLLSSRGYGLLWDNYSHSQFSGDIESNTKYRFYSESGEMIDYYFLLGPEPDDIISNYRLASGKAPLFPKWAYGLFQSKDMYETDRELLNVVNKYRVAGIPLDCIVQDWRYWEPDYWGSHIMQPFKYPDPAAMIDSLHTLNVHTMISVWPVFDQRSENYEAFNNIGAIYPNHGGNHHFYDAHNEQAREIYWNQVKSQLFGNYGWDAWWADNNEPEGYPDAFDRRDFMTAKGSGMTYYNTYPIHHVAGFYKGWRNDFPNKRLFILSRSAFSGQQRYATAVWSGDIGNDWQTYKTQLSAGLNFCLAGMPYWTTDIGGYWEVDWSIEGNQELMTRWLQYGAFCPIFRIHGKGEKALTNAEVFSPVTRDNLIKFDKLRYRLMPYIYSVGWMVTKDDYTMMRHLVMDYRTDNNVYNIDDQFLFGPSLLVNPVTAAGISQRNVYLPAGQWYDFWTGKNIVGGQTVSANAPLDILPIYVKAGAILPMAHEIQYANQAVDSLEIRVYRGADGAFVLYEDDGETNDYETGQFSEIPFIYNEDNQQLTIGQRNGNFNTMINNRIFKIVFVGENYGAGLNTPIAYDTIVHYTGNQVVVNYQPQAIPQTHFEAEDAALSGGADVFSNSTGYSGVGFAAEMNADAKVTFTIDVPQAGVYLVELRYSADQNLAGRTLRLDVNNNQSDLITVNPTKNWNTWGIAASVVGLNAGQNTLSYTAAENANIHLDCIDITLPSSQAYYQIKSRISRIRQLNTSKYITSENNALVLADKNPAKNQYWKIDKSSNGAYKLLSLTDGKSITLNASLQEGANIKMATDAGLPSQQWDITVLSSNVVRLTAKNNPFALTAGTSGDAVQHSPANIIEQIWVLEDSINSSDTVYEPFDYPLGAALSNLGDEENGWAGTWMVYDGQPADMTIEAGTQGNRLSGNLSAASGLRAYRNLKQKWTDDGNAVWLSFFFETKNPANIADTWMGLSLFDGEAERVLFGKNYGRSHLGIAGTGATEGLSSVSALNLDESWLVIKIETSGNASTENAYLWLNPAPETEPLPSAAVAQSTLQLNNGFDRIVCHLGNKIGISAAFDEIRIGKSFQEVTSADATGLERIKSAGNFNATFNKQSKTLQITGTFLENDDATVSFFDIGGRLLFREKVKINNGTNQYIVGQGKLNVNPGIYFVTFRTKRAAYANKVLVY